MGRRPDGTSEITRRVVGLVPGRAGVRIELVAAEPLVFDPVSMAFDEHGHLFVVEYVDYPNGPSSANEPPLSRIVMLEDTDADGRMDRRHVFAEHLDFAHSLMPFRNGLLVGAKTEILFLKDVDGDHRSDVREVLYRGFTPAHPQMQIGLPQWGFDNWVYFNYGPGKIERLASSSSEDRSGLPARSSGHLDMPRKEFRMHPTTFAMEPASGLGQFGNTIDRHGNRFYCTNRNPIMTAPFHLASCSAIRTLFFHAINTMWPLRAAKHRFFHWWR